jgi:hypothetical protein
MLESPEDIVASLEARLSQLTDEPRSGGTRRGRKIFRVALFVLVGGAVPFLILLRTGVFLASSLGVGPWVSVLVSALATTCVIALVVSGIIWKLLGRMHFSLVLKWVAMPLVCAYCAYAVLYVADSNTKTPEVRAYYGSLHPVLRIAVTTLILADDDLVVTDIGRHPSDYEAMGLSQPASSLHYVQPDGYVHAIDLRTRGRAPWLNWISKSYFDLVGLRTLRHVGSADHLHIALPVGRQPVRSG